MLKKYPQQVWVQFPDSRLVNVFYGAARHWLRNHEPSIPLNALLSSLEQGYPCHEELSEDVLFVDESLNPENLVASRHDLLSMLRSLSTEELSKLFARWLDFG
jgi:hypothetical protein